MFSSLPPRQQTFLAFLALVGLFFCAFIGAKRMNEPPPVAFSIPKKVPPLPEAPKKAKLITVYITGAVVKPGLISLHEGMRLVEALSRVGGTLPGADLEKVNLAQVLEDGVHVHVPLKKTHASKVRARVVAPAPKVLSINEATVDELARLPGLNLVLAERIDHYRRTFGEIYSLKELGGIDGMTEDRLSKCEPFLRL